MNVNNICTKCEKKFNKELDLNKDNKLSNKYLEPIDLKYNDTLICRKCLENLYKQRLIPEHRWKESKFNESKTNDNYQLYSLF